MWISNEQAGAILDVRERLEQRVRKYVGVAATPLQIQTLECLIDRELYHFFSVHHPRMCPEIVAKVELSYGGVLKVTLVGTTEEAIELLRRADEMSRALELLKAAA